MSSIWTAQFHCLSKAVQSHIEKRHASAFTPRIIALSCKVVALFAMLRESSRKRLCGGRWMATADDDSGG